MANRRMFSLKVVDSDAFLDMGQGSQLLYFHLAMRADDDGFVGNHKKIMRMVGSSEDDMKVLLAKKFLLPFESGIVVIKHWKIHNYIQSDRYSKTLHTEEKGSITQGENGEYEKCIQNVSKLDTQVRVELVEVSKDLASKEEFEIFYSAYPKRKKKPDALKAWVRQRPPITEVLDAIKRQKESETWKKEGGKFIPYPASWINAREWEDEVATEQINEMPILWK